MVVKVRAGEGYFSPAPPRVFAHRGLALEAPENTLLAFAAALGAGAHYVETDAHLTSDGAVVLHHDPDLATPSGRVVIAESTLEQVQAVDLGQGQRVPTLAAALSAFPDARFNVDVKVDAAARPAAAVVVAAQATARVLLTAFDERRRRTAHQAAPGTASSASKERVLVAFLAARLGAVALARRLLADVQALQIPERSGPLRLVTRELVERYHRAGVEVHVWTVNDPADMRRLLALGVDGIVTDRADLAVPIAREARVAR